MTVNEREAAWQGYRQRDGHLRCTFILYKQSNNPTGQQACGSPFEPQSIQRKNRGNISPPLSSHQYFICNLNLKHRALESHIKGLFDSSDRAKTWNKMTNYGSWLVGHVSYRLIGLHNAVQLLFFVHINQVFLLERLKWWIGIFLIGIGMYIPPRDCAYLIRTEQSTYQCSAQFCVNRSSM